MLTLGLLIVIASFIAFVLASVGIAAVGRVGMVPLGLALYVLSQLVGTIVVR